MGIPLSESALALLDGRNYAVLATVNADGSPQTSVVWVGRDGNDLLFETSERKAPKAAETVARRGLVPRVARSSALSTTVVIGTRPSRRPRPSAAP